MLSDAPEEAIAVRQRRALRQLPDHRGEQKRQQAQTPAIGTQPPWTRATQMTVKEPQRDQWVDVNERETEEVRSEPVQRAERESSRNDPLPIGAAFLFFAQPDQQTQPEKQERVPGR